MIKKKKHESDLFVRLHQAIEQMYEQGISFATMTWYVNGDQIEKVAKATLSCDQLFEMNSPLVTAALYGIRIEQDNLLGANIIELRGSDMVITLEIEQPTEREASNE